MQENNLRVVKCSSILNFLSETDFLENIFFSICSIVFPANRRCWNARTRGYLNLNAQTVLSRLVINIQLPFHKSKGCCLADILEIPGNIIRERFDVNVRSGAM